LRVLSIYIQREYWPSHYKLDHTMPPDLSGDIPFAESQQKARPDDEHDRQIAYMYRRLRPRLSGCRPIDGGRGVECDLISDGPFKSREVVTFRRPGR